MVRLLKVEHFRTEWPFSAIFENALAPLLVQFIKKTHHISWKNGLIDCGIGCRQRATDAIKGPDGRHGCELRGPGLATPFAA